jgi:hypothetical protein
VTRRVRQDASETLRPYSLSGQIATKECANGTALRLVSSQCVRMKKKNLHANRWLRSPALPVDLLSGDAVCSIQAVCDRSRTKDRKFLAAGVIKKKWSTRLLLRYAPRAESRQSAPTRLSFACATSRAAHCASS